MVSPPGVATAGRHETARNALFGGCCQRLLLAQGEAARAQDRLDSRPDNGSCGADTAFGRGVSVGRARGSV